MLYSILITSYECYGKGVEYLKENLLNVFNQTYRPIQCIVSDHSKDNVIEDMVRTLDPKGVDLIYTRYSEHYGNPCHNWNNALKYCNGDYIHYLAMDDRLASETVVEDVVHFMKKTHAKWIACSNITTHDNQIYIPKWPDDILKTNTLSGPSAIVLDTSLKHITLDPQFTWLLDADWYYRISQEAGPPVICDIILFLNRVHPHQLTNTVCSEKVKHDEYTKLMKKHNILEQVQHKYKLKFLSKLIQ